VLPKGKGITDRFLPEEIPHDPKCNAISLRLMEEAQISLVPTHVIFVPEETSGPPTMGGVLREVGMYSPLSAQHA